MSVGRYRLLPHTADLLVEVRADDFPAVCAASVEALFSLLTDRRRIRASERRTVRSAAGSPDEALRSVLQQALLLFSLHRFLVRDAGATMIGDSVVVGVRGERFDDARHPLHREVKAVTAHALSAKQGPSGVTARFVLDV